VPNLEISQANQHIKAKKEAIKRPVFMAHQSQFPTHFSTCFEGPLNG
jgi:hypothetical protein